MKFHYGERNDGRRAQAQLCNNGSFDAKLRGQIDPRKRSRRLRFELTISPVDPGNRIDYLRSCDAL